MCLWAEKLFHSLQPARGHHLSTCFQTLVRKCLCTLTNPSPRQGLGNWMQLGHFSMFSMFGVRKGPRWTSVRHQSGCSHTCWQALIKTFHKHGERTRSSCLIKQRVYEDWCQKEANTGNGSSVQALKREFLAAKDRGGKGGRALCVSTERTNNTMKNPSEVCFSGSCGYPTCRPSCEVCSRSGAGDLRRCRSAVWEPV